MKLSIKERVVVYIDGSNLYHKLRSKPLDISNTRNFDYRGLCKLLCNGRRLRHCFYCVGAVRAKPEDVKGQELRRKQQQLFAHLRSAQQNFMMRYGYIMKNAGSYHEKGVDVQLATEILIGAYEDKYDTCIVLSSDTDLIPAIKQVITLGKRVEYVGFSHQPSFGMMKHVSETRLLTRKDLEPFIFKTLV